MADAVLPHLAALAEAAVAETGYGCWQDKLVKTRFVCQSARNALRGMRCVGILSEDAEKGVMEIGVPLGVIAALCPATSPVATTIHNALIAVKSGNAIVFALHPRAKGVMARTLDILMEAASTAGLPEGALSYMPTVADRGAAELMGHTAVSLVLATGVPEMLEKAEATGKPVIFGGTGHGPAFIERSADIDQAVSDILASKTFDNGMGASAEQSIVVDAPVRKEVRNALQTAGAHFMTEEECDRFAATFFASAKGADMVGRTAEALARRAGIKVASGTRLLVAERRYVTGTDPFAREMLCPVLPFYVEDDWMEACEKCIELLLGERVGHTLVIHSKDSAVIREFAMKKPVGRMLVNTPATFGGMGATTHLFPSMTLGSGSAGHGITSENVSPAHLVYVRKVGFGIRSFAEKAKGVTLPGIEQLLPEGLRSDDVDRLSRILEEALKAMDGGTSK